MIRPATADDAPAVAALWSYYIRHTACTFHAEERTPEAVAALIAARPVFVADGPEGLAGFAHYGQFRAGDGYRHTAEHTLYVAPGAGGQGVAALSFGRWRTMPVPRPSTRSGPASVPRTRQQPTGMPASGSIMWPACPRRGASSGAGWICC